MDLVNILRSRLAATLVIATLVIIGVMPSLHTASAQTNGEVPGQALGLNSDADLWRFMRNGNAGDTQLKRPGSHLHPAHKLGPLRCKSGKRTSQTSQLQLGAILALPTPATRETCTTRVP